MFAGIFHPGIAHYGYDGRAGPQLLGQSQSGKDIAPSRGPLDYRTCAFLAILRHNKWARHRRAHFLQKAVCGFRYFFFGG
jgi:hypothetical protein